MSVSKSVLMVAYHFPPLAGSSGIQRTLRFVQQLPGHGWHPLVLTANNRAFERTSADLMADIPPGTHVRRAFALDAARHLSIGGRYPGAWARPDRWTSWRYDAVRQGMALIREHRPDAIWSTYPIATAHCIGAELQRRSGLPWIADFRDPMAQDGYPADPLTWQAYKDIELRAATQATWCCFTTPSAARVYGKQYPQAAARIALIENGYDADSFIQAELANHGSGPLNPGRVTLLHSGLVYPSERDPTQLLVALGQIRQREPAMAKRLRLRFRAAVHETLLHELADRNGVADLVEVLPALPYAQALQEMLRADVLLLLQAANCNEQIPAKLYEYLRAHRPVACLSDASGDTWATLRQAGLSRMASLADVQQIADLLTDCAKGSTSGMLPSPDAVLAADRRSRSAELAALLDGCLQRSAQPV